MFLKKSKVKLFAPISGNNMNMLKVKDPLFSKQILGPGVAIMPSDDLVTSPCVGKVIMISPTLHAIGIKTENDMEILIHIGIDTVNLNGDGFKLLCKLSQSVEVGTPLVKFDFQVMQEKKVDLTTMMIVTNHNDYKIDVLHDEILVKSSETIMIEGLRK